MAALRFHLGLAAIVLVAALLADSVEPGLAQKGKGKTKGGTPSPPGKTKGGKTKGGTTKGGKTKGGKSKGKSNGGGGGVGPFGDFLTADTVACDACQSRNTAGGVNQLTSTPKMIRFKVQAYDSSSFATGADHPVSNSRGVVSCPVSSNDPSSNAHDCSMRTRSGDSGDSTAGCPKFFTFEDTEFLAYDADAAENTGVFVENFAPGDALPQPNLFSVTTCRELFDLLTIGTTPCDQIQPSCATCDSVVSAIDQSAFTNPISVLRDCPATCGLPATYDLRTNIPAEGTIVTTNTSANADHKFSFFRPVGEAGTVGTDCEPFAINFKAFDASNDQELASEYTEYAFFGGDRMDPEASGESLPHILDETFVIVHNHGSPLPSSIRLEISGPRELCFGPPSLTKGGQQSQRSNADRTQCPAEPGSACALHTTEADCNADTANRCQFNVADGVCDRNFPCSGRELLLGPPGVRSCGIPGLHDLGFTTSGGASVHSTRPYSHSQELFDECQNSKDPFYNDEGCTSEGSPFLRCNIPNEADGSLYPGGTPVPAFFDYTQQGAFYTTDTDFLEGSLSTSLYADRNIQEDNGTFPNTFTGDLNFLNYAAEVNTNQGTRPGPVSVAGLLDVPVSQAAVRNGCGFVNSAPCVTHYPPPGSDASELSQTRSPIGARTHYGGQGSGLCFPVEGSTGVPFGTNGHKEFNSRISKELPSTYNPFFQQVVTLDVSCGGTTSLVQGDQFGMFQVDGFVRADNSDDVACGTCVGSSPTLNNVCVGDAAESSDQPPFRLNINRNICHKEGQTLVVQETCSGLNVSCAICGDHDTSGRAKTKLTSLTFRWVPEGSTSASTLLTSQVSADDSTVTLGVTADNFQTVTFAANSGEFSANTDFTVGDTTATLHTSCSQPIFVGLGIQFAGSIPGALVVIGFSTLDGRTDADCTGGVVSPPGECDLCASDDNPVSGGMGMGSKARLQELTFQWAGSQGLSSATFSAEESTVAFGIFSGGLQTVTVTANGNNFGANTDFTALGDTQTLHTSCSQPIFLGLTVTFTGGTLTITGFQNDAGRTDADCNAAPTAAPTVGPTDAPTVESDFATCSCFSLQSITEDQGLFVTPSNQTFIRPQCFMAGREGYAVNTALLVTDTVNHEVFSVFGPRFTAPCCPHFWVTCAASFYAVANNKENEMDYLGFGPGSPTDSQAIALHNSGINIGTPNCNTDPTSCCGVDALLQSDLVTTANIPGYCYTQEALFKNAPADRDLVTTEGTTCDALPPGTVIATCAALPTAVQGAHTELGVSAVSSTVVAVALATVTVAAAVGLVAKRRSTLRTLDQALADESMEEGQDSVAYSTVTRISRAGSKTMLY